MHRRRAGRRCPWRRRVGAECGVGRGRRSPGHLADDVDAALTPVRAFSQWSSTFAPRTSAPPSRALGVHRSRKASSASSSKARWARSEYACPRGVPHERPELRVRPGTRRERPRPRRPRARAGRPRAAGAPACRSSRLGSRASGLEVDDADAARRGRRSTRSIAAAQPRRARCRARTSSRHRAVAARAARSRGGSRQALGHRRVRAASRLGDPGGLELEFAPAVLDALPRATRRRSRSRAPSRRARSCRAPSPDSERRRRTVDEPVQRALLERADARRRHATAAPRRHGSSTGRPRGRPGRPRSSARQAVPVVRGRPGDLGLGQAGQRRRGLVGRRSGRDATAERARRGRGATAGGRTADGRAATGTSRTNGDGDSSSLAIVHDDDLGRRPGHGRAKMRSSSASDGSTVVDGAGRLVDALPRPRDQAVRAEQRAADPEVRPDAVLQPERRRPRRPRGRSSRTGSAPGRVPAVPAATSVSSGTSAPSRASRNTRAGASGVRSTKRLAAVNSATTPSRCRSASAATDAAPAADCPPQSPARPLRSHSPQRISSMLAPVSASARACTEAAREAGSHGARSRRRSSRAVPGRRAPRPAVRRRCGAAARELLARRASRSRRSESASNPPSGPCEQLGRDLGVERRRARGRPRRRRSGAATPSRRGAGAAGDGVRVGTSASWSAAGDARASGAAARPRPSRRPRDAAEQVVLAERAGHRDDSCAEGCRPRRCSDGVGGGRRVVGRRRAVRCRPAPAVPMRAVTRGRRARGRPGAGAPVARTTSCTAGDPEPGAEPPEHVGLARRGRPPSRGRGRRTRRPVTPRRASAREQRDGRLGASWASSTKTTRSAVDAPAGLVRVEDRGGGVVDELGRVETVARNAVDDAGYSSTKSATAAPLGTAVVVGELAQLVRRDAVLGRAHHDARASSVRNPRSAADAGAELVGPAGRCRRLRALRGGRATMRSCSPPVSSVGAG